MIMWISQKEKDDIFKKIRVLDGLKEEIENLKEFKRRTENEKLLPKYKKLIGKEVQLSVRIGCLYGNIGKLVNVAIGPDGHINACLKDRTSVDVWEITELK